MNATFTRLIAKRIVFILLMLGLTQTAALAQYPAPPAAAAAAPATWQPLGPAADGAAATGTIAPVMVISNSTPYLAYLGTNSKPTVLKYTAGAWVTVGAASFAVASVSASTPVALAVDGNTPYVAFRDVTNSNKLSVMKFNGTAWTNVGLPGFSTDITKDFTLAINNGTPYVAYNVLAKAYVWKFVGGNWISVGGDYIGATSNGFGIGLSFIGTTVYVHLRPSSTKSSLRVYSVDINDNVSSVGATGLGIVPATTHTSFYIDGTTPYVAYSTASSYGVVKFTNGTWAPVGGNVGTGQAEMRLAVYNGVPYLAYTDSGTVNNAIVKKFDGTNWVNVGAGIVSTAAGFHPSIGFNGNTAYIAYVNSSSTTVPTAGTVQVQYFNDKPLTQATSLAFTNVTTNTLTAGFTKGDGDARAVFVSEETATSPLPANATTYTANAAFKSGSQIGTSGWYCVYNGTGNTVAITGLNLGTSYKAMVIEYNGPADIQKYLTTGTPVTLTTSDGKVAVTSINRVTALLSRAASVQYTVTFDGAITGLTTANFSLTTTGINGASIASITGSGSVYTVTVNTGIGDGNITLNLINSIWVNSTLPLAGQIYTVDKTAPLISFSPPSLQTASPGNAVVYSLHYIDDNFNASTLSAGDIILNKTNSANGTVALTVSGGIYQVTISGITGAGTLGITIPAGTATDMPGNTAAGAIFATFAVVPATVPQTVTFAAIPPATYGDADFSPGGTSDNASIPVTYTSSNEAVATILDGKIHILKPGTATITATQPGDATHDAATPVTQLLTVNKGNRTITAPNISAQYGASIWVSVFYADGLSYSGTNNSVAQLLFFNVFQINGVGSVDVILTQSSDDYYNAATGVQHLTITPGVQTTSFDELPGLIYGDADFSPGATSSNAGIPIGYTSSDEAVATIIDGKIHVVKPGTVTITATQPGNGNYNAATPVIQSLTIDKRSITIQPKELQKTYGDSEFTLNAFDITAGILVGDDKVVASFGRSAGEEAGNHPMTLNQTRITSADGFTDKTANYTITLMPRDFVILKAPLTITADNYAKPAGTANPPLAYKVIGFKNGENELSLTGTISVTTTSEGNSGAGIYPIVASGVSSSNYHITFVNGNLTVTSVPQTVAFATIPATTYGDADFSPGATSSNAGIPIGYTSSDEAVATIIDGKIHVVKPGTATITATQLSDASHDAATPVTQLLTVNKADQTLSGADVTANPGDTVEVVATASSGLPVTYYTHTTSVANYVDGRYQITGVGELEVFANQAGNDFYNPAADTLHLTVNPIELTVTSNPQIIAYGDENPAFTYTVTGDTTSVAYHANGGLNYGGPRVPGNYEISRGSLNFGMNYNITFVAANLTITKKPIAFSIGEVHKVYGDADPSVSYKINGLLANDTTYTGSVTRAAGTSAGTYAYSLGTLALSNNYELNFTGGSLIIGKRPAYFNAPNVTKVYGNNDPAISFTVNNLLPGDSVTGQLVRTAGENVGMYQITPGSVAVGNNYDLIPDSTGFTFSITPRPLTIQADQKNINYGDADPVLTYSIYGGLAPGDKVIGELSVETHRYPNYYEISQNTLDITNRANYDFHFGGTSLNIARRPITLRVNPKTKLYGKGDPLLDYAITVGSVVNGDKIIDEIYRESNDNVGTYPIEVVKSFISEAYVITLIPGSLTITKAPLTIVADNQIKFAGDGNPVLSYTGQGFANANEQNRFDGDISLISVANQISPVGIYPITASGTSSNYNLTFVDGTLNVVARPIDVTLSAINVSAGSLMNFDSQYADSFVEVANSTTAITITPVAADATVTITVNGHAPSVAVPLITGYNTIMVKVAATDGGTKTYNVTVIREYSENASLRSLTLSPATKLDTVSVTPDRMYLSAKVGYAVNSITLTSVAEEEHASLIINDMMQPLGDPIPVGLEVGENEITLLVWSEQNKAARVYVLTVTRANPPSTNASVSSLTLNPSVALNVVSAAPALITYAGTVNYSLSSINVVTVTADPGATIKVNGLATGQNILSAPVTLAFGENTISVEITAEDGIAKRMHTLTITRSPSSETALAGLTLSQGTLSPGFSSAATAYTAAVPYSATAVTVTPSPADANGSITAKVNGANAVITAGAITAPLNVGDNTIAIASVAQDGTTVQTYTITVSRADNAFLNSLALSAGTLSPVFDKGTYDYTASVSSATSSITLTPTAAVAQATVKVNGVAAISGTASAPVALTFGANAIPVEVTADGVTRAYKVTVSKAGSTNAYLSKVALVPFASLTPVTGTADYNYTASVPVSASTVKLNLAAQDAGAKIRLNGTLVAGGTDSAPVALTGASTVINIAVTAEDGITVKTYKVTVNKTGSSNAYLSKVALVPFASLTPVTGTADYNYTASVPASASTVKLNLAAQDAGATIRLNGTAVAGGTDTAPVALTGASTVINIAVTAEDGITVKTYKVTVNKAGSNNAYLSKVALVPYAGLTSVTGTADYNYTASVPASASTVKLNLAAQDAGATIRLNGTAVAGGTDTAPVALAGASTVINIVVTAEDGITVKTYKVTVNKAGSSNAYLSKVALVPYAALTPVTGTADYNYTASVPASASTVKLNLAAQDAGATIRINGTAVAGGTDSAPVALAGASTVVNIAVTAEDGITVKTYKVTVNKAGSNNAYLSKVALVPFASLKAVTGTADYNYTASVPVSASTVKLNLAAQDAGATIRLNGTAVAGGTDTAPVALTGASTIINIAVTAEDGITVKTYKVTVNKTGSSNAYLSKVALVPYAALTSVTGTADYNYTASVPASASTVKLNLAAQDTGATIRINGTAVAGGTDSEPVTLTGASTVVNIAVTAEDGVTVKTYKVTVSKAAPPVIAAVTTKQGGISKVQETEQAPELQPEEITVKQAVSPNGDGINDRFTIEGIQSFPENTVRIMNRNGDVIYEAKGYDNEGKAFDGHSSKGTLQQPGTYFYSIEYKKGTESKRKTGYIVVKY